MTTKQQEKEALDSIRSIIERLGKVSYIGTALNGVLHYAEENIECDAAFVAPVIEMKPYRKTNIYATNMKPDDYAKLLAAGTVMSDEQAKCLINDEFGFEVSRIRILHEAEIDTTPAGATHLSCQKVKREPVYNATDWNYIRFNVRGCAGDSYWEMKNGMLWAVYL
jgi:hypothetical protein